MPIRDCLPIVAAFFGLCACSSAPAPATPAENSDAMGAYQQCLHRNAVGLDDPATDAATVARALAFACQVQREDVLATASRGLDPDDQARLRRQFEQDDPPRVVLLVLQRRAGVVR